MATPEEFKETLRAVSLKGSAQAAAGPVLYREGDTIYVDDSDTHSMILGDTGSMKTLRFVLPLIYTCAAAGESMLIVDPKGELCKKTHRHLEKQGYRVVTLNFRTPHLSPDRWNPLSRIAEAYHRGGMGKQEAMLLLNDFIAELFYDKPCKDPYWNESAGQFCLGLA